MKTKELIQLLQEEDPSGEIDVVVGNQAISFIENLPYFYDGRKQEVHLKNGDIYKLSYANSGSKIKIHTYDFDTIVYDREGKIEVDCSALPEYNRDKTIERYKKIAEASKRHRQEMELEDFCKWVICLARERFGEINEEELKGEAVKMFINEKMSHNDPFPADSNMYDSYCQRRETQWAGMFDVVEDEGFIEIRRKLKS